MTGFPHSFEMPETLLTMIILIGPMIQILGHIGGGDHALCVSMANLIILIARYSGSCLLIVARISDRHKIVKKKLVGRLRHHGSPIAKT